MSRGRRNKSGGRSNSSPRHSGSTAGAAPTSEAPRPNYARWRAISLSLVYVAFAAHFIHWKVAGKTLAPLELNEVMYTLELGIITAGFIFMCLLVLGTAIFGRFFCSWACHIMVLQDLCAWLLRKVGIRAKPIRSRLLLWVPPLTAFYMFLWPQVVRVWQSQTLPTFRLASDADGWASFVTNDFWRNLPNAPVIVLTFLVCGFAIVYCLGSRTFCTYVCPYGAVFALADRFSPGRIRVNDSCQQCGTCTAACTSGIRVHEEVKLHGMIVNPACMKDLDCVSACPQQALSYGLAKPALWKSARSGGRFGLRYDFSFVEEIVMAIVFVFVLLSFRGLYSRVPFLLSLALGAIAGYAAVAATRLFVRPNVNFASLRLKALGKLTGAGAAYVVGFLVFAIFVGHSSFVRYHEYRGLHEAAALASVGDESQAHAVASAAFGHLAAADRWGLIRNERVERGLISAAFALDRHDQVVLFARRTLARHPGDTWSRLRLGQSLVKLDRLPEAEHAFRTITEWTSDIPESMGPMVASAYQALGGLLAQRGDFAGAASALERALELDSSRVSVYAELGGVSAELGRIDAAIDNLRRAVDLDPTLSRAQYNLGTILAHTNRWSEAVAPYRAALAGMSDDSDLHNNLGFALMRLGDTEEATNHFQRAIAINPNNADAHFNLGRLLSSQARESEASEHFSKAAALDPRYAAILNEAG